MIALPMGLLLAMAIGIVATGGLIKLAPRLGLVDVPGSEAHKQHTRIVPTSGGIAMALAMTVGLALAWPLLDTVLLDGPADRPPLLVVLLGAVGLFALGWWDDRHPLPWWGKLGGQLVVITLVVVLGPLRIDSLAHWPVLSALFAGAWLVVVTNAYNLLDHDDGISATVAGISAAVLLGASLYAGDLAQALLWCVLIGTLAGFLTWNLPPARVYMGDAGSLPLGFLMGAGALLVTFWPSGSKASSPLAMLAPLFIVAIPVYDTAVVVVKRLRRGDHPWRGDRRHMSHRLARLGLGGRARVAVTAALQTALAAGALQLRSQEWTPSLLTIGQAVAVLIAVLLLETIRDDQ